MAAYHIPRPMPSAIKPLLLHSMGNSDGLKTELAVLRSGELRYVDSRGAAVRSQYPKNYMSRWSDPAAARAEPVFLRLGMPLDVANLKTLGGDVVLALDARVLRAHAFQLNQGWWPEQRGRAGIHGEVPGELLYPWLVRGDVLAGRTMDEAELFAHLKTLDKARRRLFGLKASTVKGGNFMLSNEVLVDSPVSLAESLRIVFAPNSLSAADAAKLRALVAKRYPLARVEKYTENAHT